MSLCAELLWLFTIPAFCKKIGVMMTAVRFTRRRFTVFINLPALFIVLLLVAKPQAHAENGSPWNVPSIFPPCGRVSHGY